MQQDVASSKEFFDDIDIKLKSYKTNLKSRMRNRTYWKIASFIFFPMGNWLAINGQILNLIEIWSNTKNSYRIFDQPSGNMALEKDGSNVYGTIDTAREFGKRTLRSRRGVGAQGICYSGLAAPFETSAQGVHRQAHWEKAAARERATGRKNCQECDIFPYSVSQQSRRRLLF